MTVLSSLILAGFLFELIEEIEKLAGDLLALNCAIKRPELRADQVLDNLLLGRRRGFRPIGIFWSFHEMSPLVGFKCMG